ncbi:double zinc ribbon and ankyrin repeat-containing protein 1 isoform X1 [Scophthalmus maximus]|uniref:double zinc ribbon and ankyrin repeat-containing protein 1 isoform X1 n=1 Tax=Scophthalmus maximus TaxID=52904 RepID=UPI001FA938B1|nr:double zinc ribbon and ankyrin repeat-containing protein 1 isoform X1 [Scophthalmus maximus]XP_035493595.2 double zinc ribbon and ankyrin repeat-containing protein 1 isoform X1 [Scophthalmus maximus]XP_035493597.2 double zinc ribbon and ankyrin repeat-containing protein 1 isoform X1 [Scophthalmus maximus]XP_035493598.2 double zinc ribbon and ankyrin repeat-containing protein 1 isoform X1 [Scophthalmus maximus]
MTAGAVSAPLIIPIIHLQTHRAKNHIDTNTPVCIQSDTPDVLIFYTLDGSNPAAAQRGSACSSRKYREPILLPAGRVSLRAVAVSSDGRQSSTVTKAFSVDLLESNESKRAEDHFLQGDGQHLTEGKPGSPENSAGSTLHPEPSMMGNSSSQPGPRFLNHGLGSLSTATFQTVSVQRSPSASSGVLQQPPPRSPRETHFLRCPQCFSFRASDPFARFCAQCGAVVPPLPQQRLPPAEGGQVLCVSCNSVVPVNTHTCLICEASVQRQLQLEDHVMCACCGSGNPAHISTCLTCESRLQPEVCVGNSAPSACSADSRMYKRINHSDAGYCDWCGSTVGHAATSCAMCWRCGASRHPYAFYCATCGVHCEAPAPPTSCSDITRSVSCTVPRQASATAAPSPDPGPVVKSAPPTADQCTQTVGLYYPSATELHRKDQQRALQLSRQQSTRDRQPPLTAISPGRGYWRKQLDHVYAHLRSYAQNNAPFRTLLGEPRLGRMVSAAIHEDVHEVSLTISFVSVPREEQQVSPDGDGAAPAGNGVRPAGGATPAGQTETLSSVTERFADSNRRHTYGSYIHGSGRNTGLMKPAKPNLTPKPPVRPSHSGVQVKGIQLLKELAPGQGEISVVQQLLDQGADPSCCGSDGRHALAVAVVNGHHDLLPVLVQRGADVDQQSGQTKNTALHEAAALGSEGLQCAEVLLSCRANVRRRNAAGQTAYDVAVSSGCNNMASLLAARTGLDLLDKLGKRSEPRRFLTNTLD